MGFYLSSTSKSRLAGVNNKLVEVVNLALTLSEVDFMVTEGLRSKDRQVQLVAEGKSRTLNSKHITGNAVDLAAVISGKVSWSLSEYYKIALAMKKAANQLGVKLIWGGVWDTNLNSLSDDIKMELESYAVRFTKATGRKPLVDGPHFEIAQ